MADVTNTKTYFLTQAQYETLRTGGSTEVTDYNGNKKTLTGLPSDGYFVCYYQNIIGPTGPRGFTGAAGDKGDKGDPGEKGATGAHISSVSGDATPAPGNTVNYTMTNSDGTTAGKFQVVNGVNIAEVRYKASSSATDAPTGTWSISPVSVPENQFLWTRVLYSNGQVAYSVAKQGGKGNTGSAAGFGTPTATVDANIGTPSVTVTASGENTAKVFSFNFKNLKGQKGDTGPVGPRISSVAASGTPAPGNTITYTMENSDGTTAGTFQVVNGVTISGTTYQASSSQTTVPTGAWSTAPVSVSEGQYLWTKISFSDGSVAYSVAKQGAKGNTGPAAGFGTPTATVDANAGTPSVTVNASGPDTAKVFSFAFKNLKGPTGSTWFSGESVATDTAGNVIQSVTGQVPPVSPKTGDYYLNLSSNDVFRYNESNLWTKVTNFKGTAGKNGTDGVTANVNGVVGNSDKEGVVTGMSYDSTTKRIVYNLQPGAVVFYEKI